MCTSPLSGEGFIFLPQTLPAEQIIFWWYRNNFKEKREKEKTNKLLDRYGSIENIEKNAIGVDGYDYMFADTDNLINEVLEERTLRQVSRLAKQEKKV